MSTYVHPVNEVKDPIKKEDSNLNKPQTPQNVFGLFVIEIILV